MKLKAISLLTSFLLALSMALVGPMAFAGQDAVPNGKLVSQIDYWFVGHLAQLDQDGRLLVWEGTISGDINGEMKWWFEIPSPVTAPIYPSGIEVLFYSARWEIWSDNEMLLAGESAGKTLAPEGVFPGAVDGIWDGHGVVTEAHGRFNPLKGRKVYETGPVIIGDTPPVSFYGTGMFVIY